MGSNSNDATMMFIGVALLAISGAVFYVTRPQHYVYISVVGEDTPTFGSYDKELVQNITDAINRALIQRG